MNPLSEFGVARPKAVFWATGLACLFLFIAVLAPTLSPTVARLMHPLTIDTDPENMLPETEEVRVFHNDMKAQFGLYDFIVVGIVNETRPEGVFTPGSLADIHALSEFAFDQTWTDAEDNPRGVVRVDVIAPSAVDNIEQAGLGAVSFEWLMEEPPATQAEASAVAAKAQRIPLYDDTLVSGDGRSMALYLPIYQKRDSYRIAQALRGKIATFENGDDYHITGLTIAQDQFGVEMFIQMAISAPLAMLLIFALMWYFFRNVKLIVAPMIVAMASVLMTMGLLIVTGNTIHIMASMIPVFIMPIAVLDAVHVLSEFHDRYYRLRDRYETIRQVMVELWRPMLFTSLTTSVGFASLALADIPPVQVFGIFVAIGVMLAWLLTMTLVPAYIMCMSAESLAGLGRSEGKTTALPKLGMAAYRGAKAIVLVTVALYAVAYVGITQIRINDNPVKWFQPEHPIRVADRTLNAAFGGTYMAYLALEAEGAAAKVTAEDLAELDDDVRSELLAAGDLQAMRMLAETRRDEAADDADYTAWDSALIALDVAEQRGEVFKYPALLTWMADLQADLGESALVGKSNGLNEIIKTVHRELLLGEEEEYRIPDSAEAVAQTLITFQSSHRPNDLWHFVTPDYRSSAIWLQLTSGDNRDMQSVVDRVETWVEENPPPTALSHDWFGLTYINVVWQQKMVSGMLTAFASSFVVVLVMLTVLYRSLLWAVLSMIPLTMSIGVMYGLLGFVGKDYDMPIAVLSSLSLGLAVDYAIHFMARSRKIVGRTGSWRTAIPVVFGEPGRAIFRNVIVVGVGFTPLIFAPLTPYQTVGVFISMILLISGIASLVILPALVTLCQKWLFRTRTSPAATGETA
ncbi:efflux RND transporter permease subunit [Litorisediminicola beolgyonensis]|uniref:RND family transporter n=1 Tax=Litorisediminicola beolgyonensis TaxID=1173614 RepID=A0ABW3ZKG3_9RHOB